MLTALLVIPCYNETERLAVECFQAFSEQHDDVGFLFVDDGSTDGTPDVIHRLMSSKPGLYSSMVLARNQGKAEAVRPGMLAALDHGLGDEMAAHAPGRARLDRGAGEEPSLRAAARAGALDVGQALLLAGEVGADLGLVWDIVRLD